MIPYISKNNNAQKYNELLHKTSSYLKIKTPNHQIEYNIKDNKTIQYNRKYSKVGHTKFYLHIHTYIHIYIHIHIVKCIMVKSSSFQPGPLHVLH